MSQRAATAEPTAAAVYEPRHPTLWAAVATIIPVAALAWPMLLGKWLIGMPGLNDQGTTGYAWRDWSAHYWRSTGRFPLWDAFEFGGIPYVGGQHGDLFYWTSFLRLVLPADTVMNIGFAVHYVIAGLLAYALLRSLRISWLGSVVGALAYELAGLALSYPAPGHDGKLFVTALLPGALWCINLAVRRRRLGAYAGLALCVGLALLSPHFQMTYYLLIAAGLFTLYAAFGGGDDAPQGTERFVAIGLALAAVLVGFGLALVEILPFLHYLPYSPRATGYSPGSGSGSFEASTSYAIPWSHLPEFFIAGFTGTTFQGTYWASNPLKLHSEYLGLPVILLAAFGLVSRERRRLIWWVGGIGLLFLLVAMGSATPFYRLWWLMPYVKQTRAPGMAIYVTALMLATLAAIGVDRLLAGEGKGQRFEKICLIAGGIIALLGLTGVLGAVATSLAQSLGESVAHQNGYDPVAAAQYYGDLAGRDAGAIRISGLIGGLALAAVGALLLARRTGRLPARLFVLLLPVVIGADLWRNGLPFWMFQAPAREGLYRPDPIIDYLKRQPPPYRVLELTNMGCPGQQACEVYGGAMLMDFGIPQALGQHSFQINTYNELLGGKNEWRYLLVSRRTWDVDAINYVLLPAGMELGQQFPAFANLATDFDTALTATTSAGKRAVLLKRKTPLPWARIVPGAVKVPSDSAAALYIANPSQQSFFDQIVLLPPNSPVEPERLTALPQPLASRVTVRSWAPGRMSLSIEPAASQNGYVVVSENWYPDWRATVDGKPVTPVRGDVTFLTIPVPAGARTIELHVQADDFQKGKKLSLAFLGLIALGFIVPVFLEKRPRG